jgi:hypothetical protein
MVKLTHILIALLFLFAGLKVARSDDACDRDRKARVALALTALNAKPSPKSLCACGDACECAAGKCPACPTAKPAAPTVTYREVWYSDGRRVWRQLEPLVGDEGCANGRCAIPR